jgi:pyruvate dehydrogenase E2 component (dihydrolipoamide acetyltransferase)
MKFSVASSSCLLVAASLTLDGGVHAFGVAPLRTATPTTSSTSFGRLTTLFMAEGSKITMPALSSTMKEGRVVSWLKSEGDAIEAGEAIMVVESDKADMDVEAFEDGFLAKIIVQEGEMAPVGEAVALMAENEADIDSVVASFGNGGAAVAAAPVAAAAPAAAALVSAGK